MSWLKKLTDVKTVVATVSAIIGLAGTIFGGVIWIDTRYAKADTVVLIEKRLTVAEIRDQLRAALDEYYFLRKQVRKYPNDIEIQDALREAKDHVDDLKKQLKEAQ